jgi:hypothetical protein
MSETETGLAMKRIFRGATAYESISGTCYVPIVAPSCCSFLTPFSLRNELRTHDLGYTSKRPGQRYNDIIAVC